MSIISIDRLEIIWFFHHHLLLIIIKKIWEFFWWDSHTSFLCLHQIIVQSKSSNEFFDYFIKNEIQIFFLIYHLLLKDFFFLYIVTNFIFVVYIELVETFSNDYINYFQPIIGFLKQFQKIEIFHKSHLKPINRGFPFKPFQFFFCFFDRNTPM